ncbi:MAG: DNA repair protein RecO [Acutalibacteraceae bacterium]|nr:DNA repair protein RecO [Acutalibacteraceae bacterium]
MIKEMSVGENDRLVTLFTRDYGIIRAFAAGAKSIKSKKGTATSLLAYGSFTILKKKDTYKIYEATPIRLFFGAGSEIDVLALAQYFCELCSVIVASGTPDGEFLRLILNSLHFLTKEKRYPPLIKAITELRAAAIAGFMPNLVACDNCGKFEDDIMYFNANEGKLLCYECKGENSGLIILDRTLLSAMRHIVYSEFSRLYSFSVPDKSANRLSEITEKYITLQTDHRFAALDFYNSVVIK